MADADVLGWVRAAAAAADEKGDGDTVVLEVGEVLAVPTWFVIASGRNDRQVKAMADAVERAVVEAGGPKPTAVEGRDSLQWVLVSYGDVAVHLFDEEARAFYELERLWRDVPVLDWRDGAGGSASVGS